MRSDNNRPLDINGRFKQDKYYIASDNEIKIDVSVIPPAVKIHKAFLTIKVSNSTFSGGIINCHKYNMPWISANTWNHTLGEKYFDPSVCGSMTFNGNRYYSIQVDPAVVQGWINDSSLNYGLLLKGNNENLIENILFSSTDDTLILNKPKLTVYYTVD